MRFGIGVMLLVLGLTTSAMATEPITHPDPPTLASAAERTMATNDLFGPSPTRAASYSLSSGWCGVSRSTDDPTNTAGNAAQFKVVYTVAADQPDRLASYAPVIQRYARFSSSTISSASGGVWGLRFDVGLACDVNALDIMTVRLSNPKSAYLTADRLSKVKAEVLSNSEIRKLMNVGPKNIVIFADGLGEGYGAAGEGEMYSDDRPGLDNAHTRGGLVSVVWGKGGSDFFGDVMPGSAAEVMLHEMSHNLGAVQLSSANSSNHLHCSDESDVMCYNDGTPTRSVCTIGVSAYDCNRDDYFNPTGRITGARGTRAGQPIWNVASSPFLCPATACASTLEAPTVALSASTTTPAAGQTITVTAVWRDSDGYVQQFAWDRDGDGTYEYSSDSVATIGLALAGPTTVGVRVTDNDGLSAASTVQIFPTTSNSGTTDGPTADLSAPASTPVRDVFTLSASGSTGDGLSYAYDLDGDGEFEYPAGAKLDVSYPTAGSRHVGVLVTDNKGRTATANRSVTVTGAGSADDTPTIFLRATLSRQAIADAIRKGVPARLTTTERVRLTVTVTDARRRTLYGKKTLTVKRGKSSTRIKLTSSAKRMLKRKSRVVVSIQGASATPAVAAAAVRSSLLRSIRR